MQMPGKLRMIIPMPQTIRFIGNVASVDIDGKQESGIEHYLIEVARSVGKREQKIRCFVLRLEVII